MKTYHLLLLTLLFSLLLSACAPAAVEVAAPVPIETQAPAATEAPAAEPTDQPAATAPAQPAASAETASQPAAPAGPVTYKIVPGESTLQYEVGETFINQNNRFNVAVGVTPQVSGEISVDTANLQNSTIGAITADVSQFTSDSGRRDGAIRDRFLESARYPMVTFTPTAIEGLPAAYQEGQDITFKVTGDLTIRETTLPASFDVTARLEGGALRGQAVITILMSDYGFGPISIGGILNTEDEAKVTLNFVARP